MPYLTNKLLPAFCLLLLASGCAVIYKQDIVQGNQIEQKNVNELVPGMTRYQVLLVMGSPVIRDPFNQDRWDYLYMVIDKKSGETTQKQLSLFFEDEKLSRIEGDFKPEEAETATKED